MSGPQFNMADALINILGLGHVCAQKRPHEDLEKRYLHSYKPRRPATEDSKYADSLIF